MKLLTSMAVLATILLGSNTASAQFGPPAVAVEQTRLEETSESVAVIGRIVPRQSGPVAARIAGAVDAMLVDVGDAVKAGDVLAELVNDEFLLARDLRAAQVRTAEAQLANARLEQQRIEQLKNSTAFQQSRYDEARYAVAEWLARVDQAKADLGQAEVDLRDSRITAPYDGVISVRQAQPGTYVRVGDPVVTLIDNTRLEIEADVPSRLLVNLDPGESVFVEHPSRGRVSATLRAVVPAEDTRTRTRTSRFTLDFSDVTHRLAVNQSITLGIPVGAKGQVVTVSKDAVVQSRGSTAVFVVEDGQAMIRPVELGAPVGNRFEVTTGLRPGEQVVVRGNETLRPGQQVRVSEG